MRATFASCCMLSYNRPQFVREAITTCVEKAGYPLEMIVHDDGSNPETQSVLRELHDTGLISLLMLNAPDHNEGQGIALNRMFRAAKGDPIIKMDHDLIFEDRWLQQSVNILKANELDPSQPRIGALGLFKYHTEPVDHTKMHIAGWPGFHEVKDFVGSAMVIPRVAWDVFGPFGERSAAFAEDYEFKMKVTETVGWCCALTPEDLVANVGFGVGPSTVAVMRDGELTSERIKSGPKVIAE